MASLHINFVGPNSELHDDMLKEFKSLGRKALTMNHYDFAEVSEVTDNPQDWKEFLQIEPIAEYITEEFNAIQDSELRKLILDINNSSSVGKAQLINVLQKQLKEHADDKKTGPAFIYTYVPLNPEEQNAENVEVLTNDPFRKST
jgi:hypothetical protein